MKKKNNLSTVILILVFLVGLSLLLYPSVSDYYNSFHTTRAIAYYSEQVAQIDDDRYEELWEAARKYNDSLNEKEDRYDLSDEDLEEYNSLLNITGDGIMGYIDIPKIDISTPIYHTTAEPVLQAAIGHIEGTSLPTGGKGTHVALSGHRGLPSARLFTDLDEIVVGDEFILQILDETLTYEVDQILIVLPEEMDALEIDPEKDYCTLVTCTPYGINTHRLLVRGHRVETKDTHTVRVTADAMQIEPIIVAPLVAVPMLLVLLIVLLVTTRRKKK